MQAITHFAVGASVSLLVLRGARPKASTSRWACLGAVAALAALSHPLLDDLAKGTYHPPAADWSDPFWVAFHVLALVGAGVFAWRFRAHWVGMASSLTPDLDWLLGRPLGLWSEGGLHSGFRSIPGLATVSETLGPAVPDLRHAPAAAAFEMVPVLVVIALLWRLTLESKDLAIAPGQVLAGLEETPRRPSLKG